MRYAPKKWGSVAILMRDSTYAVIEALIEVDRGWNDLKTTTHLSDGGMQKVLGELVKVGVVEETLAENPEGFKKKKYTLTSKARKERIYEKAKELKESLERLQKK